MVVAVAGNTPAGHLLTALTAGLEAGGRKALQSEVLVLPVKEIMAVGGGMRLVAVEAAKARRR